MPPITVQLSFPDPRPTTNPYIVQLLDALRAEPSLRVRTFSWRRALLQRADVFHAHWPEILVTGRGRLRTAVRQALFCLLMLRMRVAGTAIVRTVHNLELPSGLSRNQERLLRWFDRATDARIVLNGVTPLPASQPHTLIPHGDYRSWFGRFDRPAMVPGRVTYFGLIRRYKNVEALASAFARMPGDCTLVISGRPSSDDLRDSILRALDGDPRATTSFDFLSEADLARVASEAQLVVLPYLHMHNSGGLLAALSLDRPVLVPRNAANDELAAEVGEEWVLRYEGDLTPAVLADALERAKRIQPDARPDLTGRSWTLAGRRHAEAYHEAVRSRRPERGGAA